MTFSLFFKRSASSSDSSLEVSRCWLPPGFSITYTANKGVEHSLQIPGTLNDFILQFWPLILQPLLATHFLTDQKGGAKDDALLCIQGQLIAEDEPMPFSYSIHSRFADFPSRNQIRFSWRQICTIEDLAALSVHDLCHRQDISISSFIFSLDNFRTNMLTRLSGFGPVVAETINLEISLTSLAIKINTEALSSLKELPFSKQSFLQKISSLLENCYHFKLSSDYTTLQGELK